MKLRRLPTRLDWLSAERTRQAVPIVGTAVAFLVLFWAPATTLVRDWWMDPDAGHGLLLAPVAVWLAWKRGITTETRPAVALALITLTAAIVLRYMSGLAAELYTMRISMLLAVAALIIYQWGWRQVTRWWLPAALIALSIPLPDIVTGTLAFPLQLTASKWGATLLEWRHVPVNLAGNVIHLPGQSLFVTEACSGLRSLTALTALGLLIGGLFLTTTWGRALALAASIPVAMVLNAVRIFVTGFLVYFVNPELGEGLMHYTEGWTIFIVAFGILGTLAWAVRLAERRLRPQVLSP